MKNKIHINLLITALIIVLFAGCNNSVTNNLSRTEVLRKNWKIIQNDNPEKLTGERISQKDYNTNNWHNAVVPGTVGGSLIADSTIVNPYFGLNLQKIDTSQFRSPWWYRTTFNLNEDDLNKSVSLRFLGVNYRADLWINGIKVVGKDKLAGAYNIFTFKINEYVKTGKNVAALEVWAPLPGDYSMGFVDWNPKAPDRDMGIFRDVILEINGGIKLRSPFVQSKVDKKNLDAADLSLQVEVENNTEKTISGTVIVDYSLGKLKKKVTINGGDTISCKFTPEQYPQLRVKDVKLWWPNGMGDPNLYDINFKFVADNAILDKVSDKYGIREIDSYVDNSGNRVFEINGQFTLIRGAGWADDLFLQDTKETIEAQIRYVKEMNLNCIRLEGIWGKDEVMYDLCDENGILMMVGWSCQWEWQSHMGKPIHRKYTAYNYPEDIKLLTSYGESQFLWLRNHPSIIVWMIGSDKFPAPQIERSYIKFFNKYDTSRPYVASAAGVNDTILINDISGPTGMKMKGPYDYVPPVFWYTDTTSGGAYGFNTETSPGPNIPPLASLKKMIPADYLWPIDNNEYWKYHYNGWIFNTINPYLRAIRTRYGKSKNIEEFAFKSQLMNYEIMRPMFESFIANRPVSTGIIQWMLNSAWPHFYWQLYDWYLQPNAAYYAVKNSNKNIHAIYRYGKNDFYIANNTLDKANNLKVSIDLIDVNSKVFFTHQWEGVAEANSSSQIFKFPENIDLPEVYFIHLKVTKNDKEIDNGFYWMSRKQDILDNKRANCSGTARFNSQYADFSGLNKLPKVKLTYDYTFDKTNDEGNITIKVTNTSSSIAFFTFFDVVNKQDEPVLPIFWNDNYVTLLPGEERVYHANYSLDSYKDKPVIKIKGFNVQPEILN